MYSCPSTYCSGKFFVPMMIGVASDLSTAAGAAAAPPSTMATPSAIAKAALAARRLCFLITPPSSFVDFTRLDDRAHIRFERRNLEFQSARGQRALHDRRGGVGREREQRHAERRADQPFDAVASPG